MRAHTQGSRTKGKVSNETLEAIIQLCDTDGDGVVSFKEFTEVRAIHWKSE